MDREDIIKLAREAGAVFPADGSYHKFEFEGSLERFAVLVAAAEREACAKVCEEQTQGKSEWKEGAIACAAAIRARGETK